MLLQPAIPRLISALFPLPGEKSIKASVRAPFSQRLPEFTAEDFA
jgi:hypothetical protein